MNKILLTVLCCFISLCASTQKVFSVNSKYQADIKVYVTDKEYRADLIVFKTDKDYRAKANENKGIWYLIFVRDGQQ